MNATVEQKQKFLSVFKVEVHAMATQTLVFDEENNEFIHQNTNVYGGTERVTLDVWGGAEIIEAEGADEYVLVDKWAVMFAECNEDIEAFIEMAQDDEDGEDF